MREADRRQAGGCAGCRAARQRAGIKHGVVQDKLFLPGLRKLKHGDRQRLPRPHLQREGGVRLLGLRGRPAAGAAAFWNYKAARAAASSSICSATGATCWTIFSARWRRCPASAPRISRSAIGEDGKPYKADVDDAAYATFQLKGGVIAHINSSWCTRVRRDDLATFQVDGTHGCAVAGLHNAGPSRASTHRSRSGTPTSRSPSTSSRLAGSAEQPGLPERLQRAVGDVPAPPRRRDAASPGT